MAVSNPVVGKFMALPVRPRIDHQRIEFETCGLGFSQKHNQYKVIRTFDLYLAKDPDSCDFTNQGTWVRYLLLGQVHHGRVLEVLRTLENYQCSILPPIFMELFIGFLIP